MNSIEWYKIKEEIYYSDGSWRDIYVVETTQDDWSKWIDLINQKYSVGFYNAQTQGTETAINKGIVFDYFNRKTDLLNGATIRLGSISVKCHFCTVSEIENDIDPKEIETVEDHNRVMNYLIDVRNTLNRKVVFTAENQRDVVYILVDTKSLFKNEISDHHCRIKSYSDT